MFISWSLVTHPFIPLELLILIEEGITFNVQVHVLKSMIMGYFLV